MHGEAAGERIESLGRIGLIDGGDEKALSAGPFFVLNHAGGGPKERSFPSPGIEDFSAQTGDAAIHGVVHPIGAESKVGEAFVGDGYGGGRAGEAGRAVGVGRAGRGPEAAAEGVVGIVHGDDDEAIGALRDAIHLAVSDRLGAVEAGVGEERDGVGEIIFGAGENICALRFRLDDAVGVVVPVEVAGDAETARSGGAEDGATGAIRLENEESSGGGHRGRDAGGARAGETSDGTVLIGGGDVPDEEVAVFGGGGASVEAGGGGEGGAVGDIPRSGCEVRVVGFGGEAADVGENRGAAIEVGIDHRAALALGQWEAVGERGAGLAAVAVAGLGEADGKLGATEIFLRGVIHDAGDSVGAVNRGSAVAEHFHALEAAIRELVDVDRERGDAGFTLADGMRHEATTIDEDERVARRDAAERDGGVVAASGRTEGGGFVTGETGHLRERREEIGRLGGVADLDLGGAENRNRENFLVIEALNVRARDREGLKFDSLLGLAGRGRRGGGLREGGGGEGEGQRGPGGRIAVVGHGNLICGGRAWPEVHKDQIRVSGKIGRGKRLKNAREKGPSEIGRPVRSSSKSAKRTSGPWRWCRHRGDSQRPHRQAAARCR